MPTTEVSVRQVEFDDETDESQRWVNMFKPWMISSTYSESGKLYVNSSSSYLRTNCTTIDCLVIYNTDSTYNIQVGFKDANGAARTQEVSCGRFCILSGITPSAAGYLTIEHDGTVTDTVLAYYAVIGD